MKTNTILMLAAVATLTACGDPSGDDPATTPATSGSMDTVEGRVTDRNGAQGRFAGSGTLSATQKVEAHAVAGDGSLTFLSETELDAQGEYALEVPTDTSIVLVQAVDASGDVIGSVVVEPMQGTRLASPMDRETSVESEVFLLSDADLSTWAEIRSRVDQNVAAAISASSDQEADLIALSDAVQTSAAARAEAHAEAGLDAQAIQDASLDAAVLLSQELNAEVSGAYDAFLTAMADAETAAGATAQERVNAEADASLAMRAVLDTSDAIEVLDAAAANTARAEARVWTALTTSTLEAAGASQAVIDQATSIHAELEADLEAAASVEATAAAVADWRTELVGSADVEGSLLGQAVGADLATEIVLDAAVAAAVTAGAAIDASVQAAVEVESNSRVDVETAALQVVDLMADARSDTYAAVEAAMPAQSAAAIELVVTAHTSFRGL